MTLVRIFCLICALSRCVSELLSSQELNYRSHGLSSGETGFKHNKTSCFCQELSPCNSPLRTDIVPFMLDNGINPSSGFRFRRSTNLEENSGTLWSFQMAKELIRLKITYEKTDFPPYRYESTSAMISEPSVNVFRPFGRGKALVQRQADTVKVPNELARRKGNRGTLSTKVAEKSATDRKSSSRPRGGCRECPVNQKVVVPKGHTFALLPEPCPVAPRMWNHLSGPRPGSKIQEGVYAIRGSLGQQKKQFCEYSYQVIVNRCEPLKAKEEDSTIECSAENAWGSTCVISCGDEKEASGPTETECKEDLTWSNPVPICKNKSDCPSPKVKTKSKISCQTANMSFIEQDLLPNGSTCKFKQNGKVLSITCKDGRWLKSRKSVNLMLKQNKQSNKVKENDACNPNPCKNDGTCLRPQSNSGSPICKCRPQTQGVYCELRECYYNLCENEGLCIYQNEESVCYCSPEYGGNRCQNYINQDS